MSARSLSMDAFVTVLPAIVRWQVVNRTMLPDAYDFDLLYAEEFSNAIPVPAAVNAPSLFTAIRGLGLQLTAGEGPIEVLVVDAVGRPTSN